MRHSLLLVLPLVLGAGGCASIAEAPPTLDQPVDATVVWGNKGRGGAAGRVPGYVHALAKVAEFRPGTEAAVKIASCREPHSCDVVAHGAAETDSDDNAAARPDGRSTGSCDATTGIPFFGHIQ